MNGPRPQDQQTICALATPPGESALALIRVSGKEAFKIGRKLCPFLPSKIQSHHIYYGSLMHPQTKKTMDEVLVSCFQKGRSFTGEESIEISCHGGSFLSSVILEALILEGARLAERGEFSYRAFMNEKIDLVQAESILALIKSRSQISQSLALRGLEGSLSKNLKNLEQKLLKLLAHLEASIDFSEQDIEIFSVAKQKQELEQIKKEVKSWLKSFRQAQTNQKGFSIMLLGASNVGKSSLFNYLIEREQAIVTKIPGTTRDILFAGFLFNQREFGIKDTAGLRHTSDPVEKEGLKKIVEEEKQSDFLLFLLEAGKPFNKTPFVELKKMGYKKIEVVFSKSDQFTDPQDRKKFLKQVKDFLKKEKLSFFHLNSLWLSSFSGEGIEELKHLFFKKSHFYSEELFLFSPRQFSCFKKIEKCLKQYEALLKKDASVEFMTFELQSALNILQEILGQKNNQQVIDQIFKEFCIGK